MFDTDTSSEALAALSEVAVLESWLDHELRCESPHTPSFRGRNDSGCTVTATHRITNCTRPYLICQSRAEFKVLQIALGTTCSDCNRPASECWKIVPI